MDVRTSDVFFRQFDSQWQSFNRGIDEELESVDRLITGIDQLGTDVDRLSTDVDREINQINGALSIPSQIFSERVSVREESQWPREILQAVVLAAGGIALTFALAKISTMLAVTVVTVVIIAHAVFYFSKPVGQDREEASPPIRKGTSPNNTPSQNQELTTTTTGEVQPYSPIYTPAAPSAPSLDTAAGISTHSSAVVSEMTFSAIEMPDVLRQLPEFAWPVAMMPQVVGSIDYTSILQQSYEMLIVVAREINAEQKVASDAYDVTKCELLDASLSMELQENKKWASRLYQEYQYCFQIYLDRFRAQDTEHHLWHKIQQGQKILEPIFIQAVVEFLQLNQLQKAEAELKKVSSDLRDAWYPVIASKYFESMQYSDALKMIKETSHKCANKDEYITTIAQIHLNAERLKEALEVIKETSYHYEHRNPFIAAIAKKYFDLGMLDEAFNVLKETSYSYKHKNLFKAAIAKEHMRQGALNNAPLVGLNNALKVMKEIDSIYSGRDPLIAEITKAYIQLGQLDKALGAIKETSYPYNQRDPLIVAIAREHMRQGRLNNNLLLELKNALNVIVETSFFYAERDLVIKDIANTYFELSQFEEALSAIKKTSCHDKQRDPFIEAIAEEYFVIGNYKRAKEVIEETDYSYTGRKAFLAKIPKVK